jgi:hypothetical protein
MSEDKDAGPRLHATEELTPEEAKKRRAYHLALYRAQAEAGTTDDSDQVDAADSTMATFILPGD